MKSVNQPDLGAGLLFIAFGLFALWGGNELRVGTASNMGPGYFPRVLAIALLGLGTITCVRAWRSAPEALTRPAWRTVLGIVLSVLAFALLLQPLGLVLSTLVLVTGARWSAGPSQLKHVVLLGVILGLGAVAVFIYGLDVLLPIWPDMSFALSSRE